MNLDILVKNGLVEIEDSVQGKHIGLSRQILSTLISNISHYGFALSKEAYDRLTQLDEDGAKAWWAKVEPVLAKLTGADKKMGDHVVYKNFPQECLDMDQAEYWLKQILMYWGFSKDLFTEEEKHRASLLEQRSFKVLHLANDKSEQKIFDGLLKLPARWTADQQADVESLFLDGAKVSMPVPFKENLVQILSLLMSFDRPIHLTSAMDVLRLAVGLSDGDVTLRTNTKFRNFKRAERKYLLRLLEGCSRLEEDLARDKNKWKKLLRNLHPGDFHKDFPKVVAAYDKLYKGEVQSFNSKVELALKNEDVSALHLLTERPGDFVRRLQDLLKKFGYKTVSAIAHTELFSKLSVTQLLKLKGYLKTVNERKFRLFPPKGNWAKLQQVDNTVRIEPNIRDYVVHMVESAIFDKLIDVVPAVMLDEKTKMVKLQGNDSDVLPYGRGTAFEIPDNIKFIRTASYWQAAQGSYAEWFDNGWLFYDENWNSKGACCWTNTKVEGAVFSGDPVSSRTADGKACQMIDLYPDKLVKAGVRYAVWNILCYSRIKFSDAKEVYAALQWGEEAQTGGLFEPSRCQLSFPLTSDSYTKYVCYVDLKERKLVYMDANLKSQTNSAASNQETVAKLMPAFVEYLDTLPSVYDLFEKLPRSEYGMSVMYSDKEYPILTSPAYVFKRENELSKFEPLALENICGK